MALDPIVVGCDWQATLIVDPTIGRTPADVTADLDGASVEAKLYDASGALLATAPTATVTSSADRTIEVLFSPAETEALAPQNDCVLDVRLTTVADKVRPIQVRERLSIRSLTV